MRPPDTAQDPGTAVTEMATALRGAVSATRHSDPQALVDRIWRNRSAFGMTRMGTVTGLDRIGLPVVQVSRPYARSNSVSQGKGLSVPSAAVSALMEAIETWAAESLDIGALPRLRGDEVEATRPALFRPAMVDPSHDLAGSGLPWVPGWDFLNERQQCVPAGLVDTDYRWPLRADATVFVRTTTGLAAGCGPADAFVHAALEVIERHCVSEAHRVHGFFDRAQIDNASITDPGCRALIAQLDDAGFAVGLWDVPSPSGVDVIWCHVMDRQPEIAQLALPAEGFCCAFTLGDAVKGAILEAVQARMSAVSGARDDIDRSRYPAYPDRGRLAGWRDRLDRPWQPNAVSEDRLSRTPPASGIVDRLRQIFRQLGARMATVVPVRVDPGIGYAVLRLVAPDLRPAPEIGGP